LTPVHIMLLSQVVVCGFFLAHRMVYKLDTVKL